MKFEFKKIFEGKHKNENLIILILLLIVVVVAINYIFNDKNVTKKEYEKENNVMMVNKNVEEDSLETKLEKILSKISGTGKVKVMITYSESSSVEPIYDENSKISNTVETDKSGGTRSISQIDNQKQIIYKENGDGSKEPMTKSILEPKISGAIVTATGAGNSTVKTNIIQAVEAVTGLPTHKIQVFVMEDN